VRTETAPEVSDPISADALVELYHRHARNLHLYLARRVGTQVADDLVGEAFLLVWEQRADFDPARASAKAWLYGIATNLVRRYVRAEVRRLEARAREHGRRSTAEDVGERNGRRGRRAGAGRGVGRHGRGTAARGGRGGGPASDRGSSPDREVVPSEPGAVAGGDRRSRAKLSEVDAGSTRRLPRGSWLPAAAGALVIGSLIIPVGPGPAMHPAEASNLLARAAEVSIATGTDPVVGPAGTSTSTCTRGSRRGRPSTMDSPPIWRSLRKASGATGFRRISVRNGSTEANTPAT
jgi:hypothetical protein